MYVCMYVCMYVAIHHPHAYHACMHAGRYIGKDRHILVPLHMYIKAYSTDTVRLIVSVITYCSNGIVGMNALLSAHAMQEGKVW